MFGNIAQLRCCDAYLRSAVTSGNRRSLATTTAYRGVAVTGRCVLIVEFRDEVFAELKALLEEYGCEVVRATCGAAVAYQVNHFSPDLLLVNESMPDESGWLITCKLRLTKHRQPVWLYAAQSPRLNADSQEFCGVDEILAYGGVLSRLSLRLRERLESWLDCSGVDRGQAVRAGTNPVAA